MMKALVYDGPGSRKWTEVADPVVTDAEDAIVRVDAVTICGTDLHILKGDVPSVAPGTVLGHEAVGVVEQTGAGVRDFAPGDRVLISCISSCGRCRYCRTGSYGRCTGGGGWVLGHLIDGTQAERVRVPFADHSMHRLPSEIGDETAVLLADILPTSYEVGVRNGRVGPGDTVLIFGAGPIGLAAIATARLFSPLRVVVVDPAPTRRKTAELYGADVTLADAEEARAWVRDSTVDGVDVTIEAVGVPETFELCAELVRPCGHVANVGVHGSSATLRLESLWDRDVTITTGLVDTSSTPMLLSMLAARRISLPGLVTHRFGMGEIQEAYDIFSDAMDSGAMKVVMLGDEADIGSR
ncbi:alcohol dehydrogenase [Nocardioides luteus]|uniref:alcohol dehydrogenase catalytic domain-containing protein n=1 Tax=Nocardioides luteus TaxID=1844 RepID=UPI00285A389C|nr:alcohol dehydrogenase catalytic domain-containing protein [Nocardioides luteus]MDR7311288.1 alcohol dehydrogenase [Nocardioides luteus]